MGKHKSNELKKLTGSKEANHRAPELELTVPNPPCDLSASEQEIWNRSVLLLERMQIITAADFDLLHDYTVLRSMFGQMIQTVKDQGLMVEWTSERGKTVTRVNPLLSEALRVLPFVERMRRELGFSPETRQKRQVVDALQKSDKLEEFLDNL